MTQTQQLRHSDKKTLAGLGGGVLLEWYDWVIYGLLAAFIGPAFFPGGDPVASTLSALAVFALGFVARPVGAAILGPIADRVSHKKVMLISVSTMGITSLIIGLMPTYGQIGLASSIAIIVLRLLQGLATGAEAPIANVIAMELAPKGKSGWYLGIVSGSFVQGGAWIAMLVAFATRSSLTQETMLAWGWRIPFIIGGIMALAVLYLRRQLPETLLHKKADTGVEEVAFKGSVWREVGRNWAPLLAALFVIGGVQVLNYTWTTGLPNLANATYKEDSNVVFGITAAFGFLMVLAGPAVGALADKFGHRRIYTIVRLLGIPTMLLILLYNKPGLTTFALVMMIGGVVVSANMGLYNYIATGLIPKSCRTTGVGLAYGVGVSLFGGTASYLLLFANQAGQIGLYVLYASVLMALSVIVYHAVLRRQDKAGIRDGLTEYEVPASAAAAPVSHPQQGLDRG